MIQLERLSFCVACASEHEVYSATMAAFVLLKPVIVGVVSRELAIPRDVLAEEVSARREQMAPVSIAGASAEYRRGRILLHTGLGTQATQGEIS